MGTIQSQTNAMNATILVADDDFDLRQTLGSFLKVEGYSVIEAADGFEAVHLFVEHRPDLVLLDAMMPLSDGFEACAAMRSKPQGELVPILMLTGMTDERLITKAFEAGVSDYLSKPIRLAVLRHRVKRLIQSGRAEIALRKSEQRFRAFVEAVPDLMVRISRAGDYLDFHSPSETLPFRPSDQIIGRSIREFPISSHLNADFHEILERCFQTDSTQTLTFEVDHLAGRRHFEARLRPVSDQEALLVMRDVTDAVEGQERMRMLESALRNANDTVIITEADPIAEPGPRIVYVNETFTRTTGYLPEEVLGQSPRFLHGPNTDRRQLEKLRHALERFEPVTVEVLNYRKDGTTFLSEISIVPFADKSGRFTHFLSVNRDVTERRKLEERLRQSQKMEAVGQLASGIAHNFNNLLMVIRGYSEILFNRLPAMSPERSQIGEILQAAKRGANLVHQLATFSRKPQSPRTAVDLNNLVGEAARIAEQLIGADITITLDIEDTLPYALIDSDLILQTILNLATNGRDAMPQGGHLTIATKSVRLTSGHPAFATGEHRKVIGVLPELLPARRIMLSVTDTGTGIDPAVLDRIFEPFFTTKDTGRGTGLGLSTIYSYVVELKGFITVETFPERGSTISVFLPLGETEGEEPAVNAPKVGIRESRLGTVLFVEDNESIRRIGAERLQAEGLVVLVAETGRAALDLARRHAGPINLLVTDLVMPELGGDELIRQFRKLYPDAGIIIQTGNPDRFRATVEMDRHIPILGKPYSLDDLVSAVLEYLVAADSRPPRSP